VTCPTCGGGMRRLCVVEGRAHFHCTKCGTYRLLCGYGPTGEPVVEDSVALAFLWGAVGACLGAATKGAV
jgi:hypothetical protein